MLSALRTFARILVRYGPALMAWYVGGEAVHRLLVQLAGFVGGYTTLGGLLLLPLAVGARLVAYVAMYLTVRPALPHLNGATQGGYREFVRAVLWAILPFSIFYAAWGMLEADQREFFVIASDIAFRETGFGLGEEIVDRGGLISVGVLPVTVLVIALLARVLLARFRESLPVWTASLAAYAELLWTFMLFTLVGQWLAGVRAWFAGRAGVMWLEEFGDGVAASLPTVAGLWEAVLWTVGIVTAAVIIPAAWLAIAGVIYGADADVLPPLLQRGTAVLRGAVGGLSRTLLRRVEDLWAAFAAIWRGGPRLFGTFALVYAVWALAEQLVARGVLAAFGGHEADFWAAWLPLIMTGVAMLSEPLRVAIVATAFDTVVGRPEAGIGARGSAVDAEAGDLAVDRDVQPERAVGVGGKKEDGEDVVGIHPLAT